MTRILKGIGIAFGTLLIVLILWYLFVFDWNDLKDHVSTAVGGRTHRDFSIDSMDVHLSLTPRVRLERVRLENATWSQDPQMMQVETIDFTIKLLPLLRGRWVLPELRFEQPRIALERNAKGTSNWDFAADPAGEVAIEVAVPEERGEFPIIGRLIVSDGTLIYRDMARNISVESKVNTAVGLNPPGADQIRLDGRGRFEGRPFTLRFTGGSLLELREARDPYPMDIAAQIGETRIRVQGTAVDPVRGEGLKLQMKLEGRDLAETFPIFGIPFPPTRAYHIAGELSRDGKEWGLKNFSGAIGDSDLSGDLRLNLAPDPPYMQARFSSEKLRLSELLGFFGIRPDSKRPTSDRIIPATPINLNRLRAMNMDVEFRAERVLAAKVPAQRMKYHLHLEDGRLSFAPLQFHMAEGTIDGEIHLDAKGEHPSLAADLHVRHMRLGRFLPKLEAAGVAYGIFGGRLKLDGQGDSFREIMASSDGGIWLSMSGGAMDEVVFAAAGVDVPELLRLVGAEKTPVPLRCSVLSFDLNDGMLDTNVVVIDAEKSTLFGEGTIDLRTERVDLTIDSEAKDPSPLAVGGTIEIEGRLRKPTVQLDLADAAGQAGAAAALGAILTPLAAILPFIDPGSGEDSECSELFAQAGRSIE